MATPRAPPCAQAAGHPCAPVTPIRPIPLQGRRRLYIGLAVAYRGLCDPRRVHAKAARTRPPRPGTA
ncbi:hypothetical protein FOB29_09420 [Bordetella hinzii]|nr:hypothetical protein FOB29_09420 [Bordetella hinzii]